MKMIIELHAGEDAGHLVIWSRKNTLNIFLYIFFQITYKKKMCYFWEKKLRPKTRTVIPWFWRVNRSWPENRGHDQSFLLAEYCL